MTRENKEVVSLLLQTYKDIRLMIMSAPNKIRSMESFDFGIVNMKFGIRFITITSPDFILENDPDCLGIYRFDETN